MSSMTICCRAFPYWKLRWCSKRLLSPTCITCRLLFYFSSQHKITKFFMLQKISYRKYCTLVNNRYFVVYYIWRCNMLYKLQWQHVFSCIFVVYPLLKNRRERSSPMSAPFCFSRFCSCKIFFLCALIQKNLAVLPLPYSAEIIYT